jgi:hypothetical protein
MKKQYSFENKHGTFTGYSYGCRCTACAATQKAKGQEYRQRVRGTEPPEHGYSGYQTFACRCDVCSDAHRHRIRLHTYGLDENTFKELLEQQDGKCAICFGDVTEGLNLVVDHNHETGKVRGILCSICNMSLGGFKDSLEYLRSAVKYLEES